ncbi:MAG: HAMP domain-containing histidine kinase, partial [Actinomycetota bacterium]|nr:HAMP domain-containing histidine kinase [Actinomycetota bacterium]
VVFLARDGREIVADGSLTTRAVRGALSTLGIFRNVTAQKEVERLKQEFVSTVSHELRTPLASIQGSLGLLATGAMGSLPKEAVEVVAIAERNVVRLLGIINDILDLERLQSGRLNMTLAPTRMSGVVDRSIEALKGFVDQKQIRFDVLASSGRAFVDADRIVQVLVNLLSNAAKFSPRATTVSVASMEAAGWVKVSVRDEGPGIPVLYHSSIFERFRQVTSPERPSKGGTGLGLAICKTIVEAHGGTIGVESEEGHGSTFWFHVPAVSVDLDEAAAHRSAF